ncbi:MAG: TonB-dependent receptor [Xanthomonadales bacterium]|nr:TonB-dependent receptor [Xanthomonadales bacterium]
MISLLIAMSLPLAAWAEPAPRAAPTELDEVTVTATLNQRDLRTAPASVTVVDRAELDRRAPPTLLEAIRGLPGVTLSPRQVGGRKTFSLRGLEGKHVLVLVDGRRISASDDVAGHSDYQYGWLPMEAVERIEVVRGPMSTLYGSEALGGVINVITRRGQGDWHGELQLRGLALLGDEGGDGHRSTFVTRGGLGERVGLAVEGEHSRIDAVPLREDARYAEQEGSDARSLGVSARIDLTDRQRLEFGARSGDEERWYGDVTRAGLAYDNHYELARDTVHLDWFAGVGVADLVLRGYRSELDITNWRTENVEPTRPQRLVDRVLDGHASAGFGAHRVTAGFELREEYLANSGLAGGRDDATHRALFVQDEWQIAERLGFTGGLRIDEHEFFGSQPSPRAYLVYEASDTWVLKGGWGRAFKAPTLKQISPDYVGAEGPHSFLGNAAIQPETADAFELAADFLSGPWTLRASLFDTQVDDLITYRLIEQQGPRRIYQYDNVDAARLRGAEIGGEYALSESLQFGLDLSLLDSEDRATGAELEYRPEHAVNARIDWAPSEAWSLRFGGERTGKQTGAGVLLPGYTLWNAAVTRRFGEHLRLRLGLDNLTDVRLDGRSVDYGYAERGRGVSLSVGVGF